jgi:hypothetical protein
VLNPIAETDAILELLSVKLQAVCSFMRDSSSSVQTSCESA